MIKLPPAAAFFAAALAVTVVVVYLPGLRGSFVFDDWASLPALGEGGTINTVSRAIRFITSGTSDPIGRPLSLATFLLNARDWPADPFPFKATNLAIHVVNALLLGTLLTRLGRALKLAEQISIRAAWLAAAAWSLHPFLASTVLYIVQREAMLATSFAFIALHCWLAGRRRVELDLPNANAWLYGGAGTATLLAMLCKANGIVIPLIGLAVTAALPTIRGPRASQYRLYVRVAMLVPAILLLAGLVALALAQINDPPLPQRGWTIGQRLLTEPSVLIDYLARLWLVRPAGGSFFHDQMDVAKGVFHPWYVIPSLLACVVGATAAVIGRRRFPALSAAVLFFFAGHVLESTSVPLELYFEHRNYLPSALMFWPLAIATISSRFSWLRMCVPIVLVAGLCTLTWLQASLWGDQRTQAEVWVQLQPDSPRAQAYAAGTEFSSGNFKIARIRIDNARHQFNNQPQIAINLLDIHCETGGITTDDLTYASNVFATAPRDPGSLVTRWLESRIASLPSPTCPGLTSKALRNLLQALSRNPQVISLPGRRQDVAHLYGAIALSEGDASSAVHYFRDALSQEPTPKVALYEAAMLGRAKRPGLGLQHLAYLTMFSPRPLHTLADPMAWLHDRILDRQHYWPGEIDHLRDELVHAEQRQQDTRNDH